MTDEQKIETPTDEAGEAVSEPESSGPEIAAADVPASDTDIEASDDAEAADVEPVADPVPLTAAERLYRQQSPRYIYD